MLCPWPFNSDGGSPQAALVGVQGSVKAVNITSSKQQQAWVRTCTLPLCQVDCLTCSSSNNPLTVFVGGRLAHVSPTRMYPHHIPHSSLS